MRPKLFCVYNAFLASYVLIFVVVLVILWKKRLQEVPALENVQFRRQYTVEGNKIEKGMRREKIRMQFYSQHDNEPSRVLSCHCLITFH